MQIHTFKTNIINTIHVQRVEKHISHIDGIDRWNVDLHDNDKILRVEAEELSAEAIAIAVQNAGYYCTELE
jgi:copper chaperone CopZ